MDSKQQQEYKERDEWRKELYDLLLETSAKIDAHVQAEDRAWEQFRDELKEHREAISKLQQTVNNGITDKVYEVHNEMKEVRKEMPEYVHRGEKRKDVSLRVSMIAMGISGVAALASVVLVFSSVLGG